MLDVKDLNIEFHDHLVPETVVHWRSPDFCPAMI